MPLFPNNSIELLIKQPDMSGDTYVVHRPYKLTPSTQFQPITDLYGVVEQRPDVEFSLGHDRRPRDADGISIHDCYEYGEELFLQAIDEIEAVTVVQTSGWSLSSVSPERLRSHTIRSEAGADEIEPSPSAHDILVICSKPSIYQFLRGGILPVDMEQRSSKLADLTLEGSIDSQPIAFSQFTEHRQVHAPNIEQQPLVVLGMFFQVTPMGQ